MGGTLLERLPRAVRLTPIGRAMVPYARAALADAERAIAAARRAAGVDEGELQVATLFHCLVAGSPLSVATQASG